MKKNIALLLLVTFIFALSLSGSVFAASNTKFISPSQTISTVPVDFYNPSLMSGSSLRGLQPPDTRWNWGLGNYAGSFSQVSRTGIYTNYLFQPNSNGTLYFNVLLYEDGSTAENFFIGVYNENDRLVSTGSSVVSQSFQWGTFAFDNLSPTTYYYFKLYTSYYGTVHGDFTVSR